MDRRRYLAALVTVPVTALAGCADSGSADGGSTDAQTATDTETATDTQTATDTETATDTQTATDTETATASPTDTQTATDASMGTDTATRTASATPTATPTETVPSEQTVQVAPGSLRFAPRSFEIAAGGTVEWVWESGGHNIVVDSQPAGSEWAGTPDGAGTTYDEGYTHTDTFEVPGTYEYYCAPHQSIMTGSFTVVE